MSKRSSEGEGSSDAKRTKTESEEGKGDGVTLACPPKKEDEFDVTVQLIDGDEVSVTVGCDAQWYEVIEKVCADKGYEPTLVRLVSGDKELFPEDSLKDDGAVQGMSVSITPQENKYLSYVLHIERMGSVERNPPASEKALRELDGQVPGFRNSDLRKLLTVTDGIELANIGETIPSAGDLMEQVGYNIMPVLQGQRALLLPFGLVDCDFCWKVISDDLIVMVDVECESHECLGSMDAWFKTEIRALRTGEDLSGDRENKYRLNKEQISKARSIGGILLNRASRFMNGSDDEDY